MPKRREGDDPFGMSLLDMLCCGFGAAALLFVLSEFGLEGKLQAKESAISAVRVQSAATLDQLDALSAYAATSKPSSSSPDSPPPRPSTGDYGRLAEARRLVILLDTSGSMAGWDREGAALARERLVQSGGTDPDSKWSRTVEVLSGLLTGMRKLEAVAVLRLGEGREGDPGRCSGCPLVRNARGGPWHNTSSKELALLMHAVRKSVPDGGSGHLVGLDQALKLVTEGPDSERADTLVVVTDGLPNHGRSLSPGEPDHPAPDAVVSSESRLSRADAVLAEFGPRLVAARAKSPDFRLHVICMDWPEDNELAGFALELAHLGGGLIAFPQTARPPVVQ